MGRCTSKSLELKEVRCCHYWCVASPDLVFTSSLLMGKSRLREGVGPVPSHTASRRGWRLPRVGPLGQAPLCSPSRKPLRSAARAAGEEERVWLRDRQALEAEPGPAPENNLLGPPGQSEGVGTRVETSCLEREDWEAAAGQQGGSWSVPCSPDKQHQAASGKSGHMGGAAGPKGTLGTWG